MANYNKSFLKEKILVSGANGFTGRFVCEELIKRNISFSVILRPGSDYQWFKEKNIFVFYADLNNSRQLTKVLDGSHIFINIASIGFGAAKTILNSCNDSSIERVIFISSTSIFTNLNSKSKKIRLEAESIIKRSNLNWTILRPTMIYGTPDDRNMIRLIKWIDKVAFIPIFGKGNSKQQPIFVADLAWSIVEIINNKKTFNKIFNLSGKEPITFLRIINIISSYVGKKPLKIYLPYLFFAKIFKLFELLGLKFFIKSEQIMRLNEDKTFSYSEAAKVFGFKPKDFSEGILSEINIYKINRKDL